MARDEETIECQDDPGWQHCTSVGGSKRKVKCNWCEKEMHGGVSRFKQHLAGVKGQVKSCELCPSELKNEMRTLLRGKKVIKEIKRDHEIELLDEISGHVEGERIPIRTPDFSKYSEDDPEYLPLDSSDDEDEDLDLRVAKWESLRQLQVDEECHRFDGAGPFRNESSSSGLAASSRRPTVYGGGIDLGTLDAFAFRTRSVRQPTIKQTMRGMKKRAETSAYALKSITKWFLHSGVPVDAVKSPYFQSMLDAVAKHGPSLTAPTPKDIYGVGLDTEVAELQTWVDNFKLVWKERGCTLMCDEWTWNTKKSVINFFVYCTEGTIFLRSIDTSYQTKSANYLFNLIDGMIERIGEDYVVQVVTSNDVSYEAAGKKLMEKKKHLYWVPCVAHSMDLMLEDIDKNKFVSQVVAQAQQVTQFIYGHNHILNMMRVNVTQGQDLIRAGPTRFASNFISLENLQKHKNNLIAFFNNQEYLEYCTINLRDDSISAAGEVNRIVGDTLFWERVAYCLKMMEPLVQVLRMVDGDDKNDVGYLYETMNKAKEMIKKKFVTGYKKWWDIIDRRWEMTLHHPLYAAV